MRTTLRWFGLPVCPICRDQLQDFLWVTAIQTIVWLAGGISGLFFLIDETLLFIALVIIKHWLHASATKARPAAG